MLNKVVLIGRLTADPELKHTPADIAVANFTLAVDRSFKKDGEKVTDFIDCVAWRGTAEFMARFIQKGRMIAVSGALQVRTWEDKDGKKRKAVEVVADEVFFADSKKTEQAESRPDFTPVGNDEELPF